MKELINLMPPPAKQLRLRRLYLKRARAIYTTLLLSLVLVGAGYGVAYGVFWYSSRTAVAQLSMDIEQANSATQQTEKINVLLKEANKRLTDTRPWLPDVAQALKAVPAEIIITGIDITSETKVIVMSGQSNSRSATLQFQKNLEGLPWVESVEAPLQNFASGPDVSFRFTLTRKP